MRVQPDSGLQAPHDVEDLDAGTRRWPDDVRAIDVDVACTGRDKRRRRDELWMKTGRQHAGDDTLPAADHHRASDNRRVAVEPTFEERVWQDDAILARRRRPAERKARAREIPEPVSDRGDLGLHHLVTNVDRLRSGEESDQLVEHGGLIAPGDEIGRHDDVFLAAIVNRRDPDQALRMRIRQRPQEHRVDDAEHGGVQTDPECKREHDDDGEPVRGAADEGRNGCPGRDDPTRPGSRSCAPLPSSVWRCRMLAWLRCRPSSGAIPRAMFSSVSRRMCIADLIVQTVEALARAPPHAGLSTRAIARASFSHFEVSMASCLRPLGVRR